ncbi:endonuclease/exonuclease/phosphatase family protein, partial [Proteus mirabilis]|uniref:endonuclease/exonuclease/phosphatase family protein n=1 Tax=Proteus mirabilis TaxID=584 RepID=UPI001C891C09
MSETNSQGRKEKNREQGRIDKLNCIYFNARGLTGKADELRAWLGTWDPDIIAITETWLRDGQDWQLMFQHTNCIGIIERGSGAKGEWHF